MHANRLDNDAMRRIAVRTRQLMIERSDHDISRWMEKNAEYVLLLAKCTWLATREELTREDNANAD